MAPEEDSSEEEDVAPPKAARGRGAKAAAKKTTKPTRSSTGDRKVNSEYYKHACLNDMPVKG